MSAPRRTVLTICAGAAFAACLIFGMREAAAQTYPVSLRTSDAEAIRLMQLDSSLARIEADSTRRATWEALPNLVVGLASIPAGALAFNRGANAAGAQIMIGGGIPLLIGVLDLTVHRQPLRELHAHFLARKSSMSAAGAIEATELEWREKRAPCARRVSAPA